MVHVQTEQRGAVLIAVAVTLAIVALVIFAKIAKQDSERILTRQTGSGSTLTSLDTALATFVAQNRRLPCPANGTLPSTNANAGIEQRNANSGACIPANQRNGVVPWVTLGISEDMALDAWGGRITYRVHPSLTARFTAVVPPYNPMDMTNCNRTPGTGAAAFNPTVNTLGTTPYPECINTAACAGAACTDINNVLNNNGLPVTDGGGWLNQPSARTGAAYVLISHGPNASGAYLPSGALSVGTGTIGTSEALNRNGLIIMTGSVVAQSYRDAPYNNTQTALHFDDILSRPTITVVLTNANLGPRKP